MGRIQQYNRCARARGRYGSLCLIAPFTSALGVRAPDYLPDFLRVRGKEGQWEKWEGSVGKGERVSGKGGKSQNVLRFRFNNSSPQRLSSKEDSQRLILYLREEDNHSSITTSNTMANVYSRTRGSTHTKWK